MEAQPVNPSPLLSSAQMPSIGSLINESFQTLKKSWIHFTVFSLINLVIGFAVFVVFAIVGVLLAIPLGIWGFFGELIANKGSALPYISPLAIGGVAILYLLFIIAMIVISGMFQIGYILIANNNGEKVEYGAILKKSFSLVGPYFWVSSLSGLLIFGGMFVFLFLGILFAIFFMFVTYEVILGNKKSMAALRGSMSIVKQNFWDVVGRGLVLFLLGIAIQIPRLIFQILPAALSGSDSSGSAIFAGVLNMLITLVYIVVSILWGWFAMVYTLNLYKHAKAATKADQPVSLMWIVIVAVIGYVIMAATFWFVGIGIGQILQSGALQKAVQNVQKQQIQNNQLPLPSGLEMDSPYNTYPSNPQYQSDPETQNTY